MSSWTESLARLFVAHRARLEALVARRIGDRDVAADLVQEAFARVLGAGTAGSTEADTRVLYATARNVTIDHGLMVARRQRILSALAPEQLARDASSPQETLEAQEGLGALDAALDELPARTKDVFILRRVHGQSNGEIASALGISVSAVEKHLVRAMRHCQSRLAGHLKSR